MRPPPARRCAPRSTAPGGCRGVRARPAEVLSRHRSYNLVRWRAGAQPLCEGCFRRRPSPPVSISLVEESENHAVIPSQTCVELGFAISEHDNLNLVAPLEPKVLL